MLLIITAILATTATTSIAASSSFLTELMMIVLTALITTLITGTTSMLGFWLLYAKNLITREEAEKMMKDHSPYLADKQLIFNRLDTKDKVIDDIVRTMHEILVLVQDLRIEFKSLSVQMNNIRDN